MQRVEEVISAIIQWVVVLVVATLPIVLNVDAARRLRRSVAVGNEFSWSQRAAYVGAVSNVLVYVLPLALLIHNIIVNDPWDSDPFFDAMLAFVLLSIVLAIVGPKNVRAQLLIGVLLPLVFWLSLPHGIL